MENGQVVPLGDVNYDLLPGSFLGIIGCQFLPKKTSVRPHNAVFAGVVAGVPVEDANANLLFGSFLRCLPDCAVGYVKQKVVKTGR